MADRIRFHLDEHMNHEIARALRRVGIDVTTTSDAGLRTRPDESQLAFIVRTGRVIVTDDRELLARLQADANHPGAVACQRHRQSIGQIIRFLRLLHEVVDAPQMTGRIERV